MLVASVVVGTVLVCGVTTVRNDDEPAGPRPPLPPGKVIVPSPVMVKIVSPPVPPVGVAVLPPDAAAPMVIEPPVIDALEMSIHIRLSPYTPPLPPLPDAVPDAPEIPAPPPPPAPLPRGLTAVAPAGFVHDVLLK